ncbi:hypothetical protein CR956_00090 [Candidatus Saccharibacteria bacterium]|nr:MAG: hypothetical protein CR956_00090 [Candidatus Saccharibacteria bacterium]
MEDLINQLRALEPGYKPSDQTTVHIQDKTLLSFIGAFAVGKTTLINCISAIDDRFTDAVGFTTRPPRGDESDYRFIEHNQDNIKQIISKVQNGEFVNFSVHPTTGYVYGTEPGDYKSQFCMLATTASSFELSTSKLPFKQVKPITIVVQPELWQGRISARLGQQSDIKRMIEAKQSLEWCLASDQTIFIDNSSLDIIKTSKNFIDLIDNLDDYDPAPGKKVAQDMLGFINSH